MLSAFNNFKKTKKGIPERTPFKKLRFKKLRFLKTISQ
jgi:hypothetical protein